MSELDYPGTAIGETNYAMLIQLQTGNVNHSDVIKDSVTIAMDGNATTNDWAIAVPDDGDGDGQVIVANHNCRIMRNANRIEALARRAGLTKMELETHNEFAGRVYVYLMSRLCHDLEMRGRPFEDYANAYIVLLPNLARACRMPRDIQLLAYYSRNKEDKLRLPYSFELDIQRGMLVPLGVILPTDVDTVTGILISPEPVGTMVYFPGLHNEGDGVILNTMVAMKHPQNTQHEHFVLFGRQDMCLYGLLDLEAHDIRLARLEVVEVSAFVLHIVNKAAIMLARVIRAGRLSNYVQWMLELPTFATVPALTAHEETILLGVCHTMAHFDIPSNVMAQIRRAALGADLDNMLFRCVGTYLLTVCQQGSMDPRPLDYLLKHNEWVCPYGGMRYTANQLGGVYVVRHPIPRVGNAALPLNPRRITELPRSALVA